MKTLIKFFAIVLLMATSANVKSFNPNLPKGIVYQISLNSIDIEKSQTVISEYPYLTRIIKTSQSSYVFGNYTSYSQVDSVKMQLETAGCTDIEILAYNNQIEISVAEAISKQYKEDMLTNEASNERNKGKRISTREVNHLLEVQRSGLRHYYALAIPVKSHETVDKLLEQIGNDQIIEINTDSEIYSIGRYEKLEDVIKARQRFLNGEINDVFIMAQISNEQLDVDDYKNFAITVQAMVNDLADN